MKRNEFQNYRSPKNQTAAVMKYSGITIEATVNELKQILPSLIPTDSQYCFRHKNDVLLYDYNEPIPIKPDETIKWHIKAYGTQDSIYKKQQLLIELNKIRTK